ncbi:unnamed protein product, partial [Brachionus calyciflorus]
PLVDSRVRVQLPIHDTKNLPQINSSVLFVHLKTSISSPKFDKLWRDGLFLKLIEKLTPRFWLILKLYYDSSNGCVSLNSVVSKIFKIYCGVKQGGVLSAFLFNIFKNDLIESCLQLNVGALINKLNVSIIAYADKFNESK